MIKDLALKVVKGIWMLFIFYVMGMFIIFFANMFGVGL